MLRRYSYNGISDQYILPLQHSHLFNHPVLGGHHIVLQLLAALLQIGLAVGHRFEPTDHDRLVRFQEGDAARTVGQSP